MAKTTRAGRAREELTKLRGKEPPLRCGEPMRTWHMKYTALVVEFMLTLPDDRLAEWDVLFTALYEFSGMGFHHFAQDDVRTEDQAWFRVDPWEHMLFARLFTQIPKTHDARSFAGDYLAFIIYLGRERVLGREVCRALYRRYGDLLRVAA